jgi:hypothetical protein
VAEVFNPAGGGWSLRRIEKVEKRPGRRATTAAEARRGEPIRDAVPTRYLVWYEGISGRRTLGSSATVHVTAASWYAE